MKLDPTAERIARILANRPQPKPLRCPECDSTEFSGAEPYVCVHCLSEYESLAELEVA